MAIFSHTLIFEGPGHGWQETMYFFRSTHDVDGALQWVSPLIADKRKELLGAQYYIKGQRVTMVYNNASERVRRVSTRQKFFKAPTVNNPGEDTGTSLQVLMTTANKDSSKLTFLGGPWAAIFPFANAYDPNANGWATVFNQWGAALIAKQMGWLKGATSQSAEITGYEFNPENGHTTYTLAAPGIDWGLMPGPTRVYVEFPLSKSPLDGPQIVIPMSNVQAITAEPRPAGPFVVKGLMRLKTYELARLDTTNNQGATGTVIGENPVSRKRGRPLWVNRGRRQVPNRW